MNNFNIFAVKEDFLIADIGHNKCHDDAQADGDDNAVKQPRADKRVKSSQFLRADNISKAF